MEIQITFEDLTEYPDSKASDTWKPGTLRKRYTFNPANSSPTEVAAAFDQMKYEVIHMLAYQKGVRNYS